VTLAAVVVCSPLLVTTRAARRCAPCPSTHAKSCIPSPLKTYGASCSVQRTRESITNSTRATFGPATPTGRAVHRRAFESTAPLLIEDSTPSGGSAVAREPHDVHMSMSAAAAGGEKKVNARKDGCHRRSCCAVKALGHRLHAACRSLATVWNVARGVESSSGGGVPGDGAVRGPGAVRGGDACWGQATAAPRRARAPGRRAGLANAIVDALWPEDPPASAAQSVESYVSRLRAALRAAGAADGIIASPPAVIG